MRKKGENSLKCAGRAAIAPCRNNGFTAWYRKSNRPLHRLYTSPTAMTRSTRTQHGRSIKGGRPRHLGYEPGAPFLAFFSNEVEPSLLLDRLRNREKS